MKVILKQDNDKLGKTGEIVSVKDGYAMNYLIPNGVAMKATTSNTRVLEELKKQKSKKIEKEIAESEKLAAVLSSVTLEIKAKAADDVKLFGSVSSGSIHEALLHLGHNIDKKQIVLDEPIKEIGIKDVEIRLQGNVKAQIKVNVIKED
ncbi:MAG TPA: 50S ribosomal protein L9 [Ignavibacteria bacterium]|nr:50S ribosomal protein L9 [Ignavibacteria bacterium]